MKCKWNKEEWRGQGVRGKISGTIFTLGITAGLLASCGSGESADQQDSAQQESVQAADAYDGVVKTSIYVKGYEGGPGVPKLIIEQIGRAHV